MILWSSSLHQYWSYWNICWLKNESILIFRRNLQRVYIWSILNSWKLKIRHTMRKLKKEMRYWIHWITWISITFLHLPVVLFSGKFYTKITDFCPQEILKLRKKITSTVQVLTHLKEKLQFVQAENQVQKGRLREVEAEAAMVCIGIYIN